ncbi:MAG: hypothetical protein ACRC50_02965 [Gaiella sp.]
MVLVKIILVLALLVAGLAVVQQQQVVQRAGIVGRCEEVRAPANDVRGTQWWSCSEGLITGYPSLIKDNCALRLRLESRQVWRCPTPIPRPSAV